VDLSDLRSFVKFVLFSLRKLLYWGGEKIATITADQKGWKSYEFELPAGLNENDFTRLEFKSVGISDSFGGLIDDVSVVRTS